MLPGGSPLASTPLASSGSGGDVLSDTVSFAGTLDPTLNIQGVIADALSLPDVGAGSWAVGETIADSSLFTDAVIDNLIELVSETLLDAISFAGIIVNPLEGELSESVVFSDTAAVTTVVTIIADAMAAADSVTGTVVANALVADTFAATEFLKLIFPFVITDTLSSVDTATALRTAVQELAETLSLLDSASAARALALAVVSALVLADVAREVDVIQDAVALADAVAGVTAVAKVVAETLLAADTVAGSLVAVLSVADALALTGALTGTLTASEVLQDSFEFVVFDAASGGVYSAWVMNTKNLGVTQYDNFNFNSVAKLAGSYYAASPSGLYLLGGANDSGTNISAVVRTGKSNFGTSAKKRVVDAYIGVDADEKLILKTIADDGVERWYRAQQSTTLNTQRFKLGKGVKSNFWQFELINDEGTYFELESLELRPVVLDRRI